MKPALQKNDVLWNALGSLVYALASVVLSFAVIRIAGPRDGGIFGFGFSTLGQQMFIIAYFGIRPFHITDMKPEYSFGDYLKTRRFTTLLAVAGAFFFVLFFRTIGKYDPYRALALFLICLYKILDGYADVYESELQRQGLLYRGGQSLCFRTLLSVAVLLLTLMSSHSLILAVLLTDLAQLFGCWLFAARVLREEDAVKKRDFAEKGSSLQTVDYLPDSRRCLTLLKNTSLLFVSVFLDFYVFSAAKYAVDEVMGSEVSGVFNILFMPTSFIYLVVNFLIRPMLTGLASSFSAGDQKEFSRECRFMLFSALLISALVMAGAVLLGKPVLAVFEKVLGDHYHGVMTGEFTSFLMILAGGCLYAFANVLYYILVTIRAQKEIFLSYLAAAALAFAFAENAVCHGGIRAASAVYVLLMLLLLAFFAAFSGFKLRKDWRKA